MSSRLNPNAMPFVPRSSAARTMQRRFRGHRSRRDLTRKKDAASQIQRHMRGYRSRTGKGENWGLPYPLSRRDLDFDPELQRRIFEESMYGTTRGLEPIREEIELQDTRMKDYDDVLSRLDKEKEDMGSMYNLGKQAHLDKKERYLQNEADVIVKQMYDMRDKPSRLRSEEFYQSHKEKYGDQPEIDRIRNILRESVMDEHSTMYHHPGLSHKIEAIRDIENARQKIYIDKEDERRTAIWSRLQAENRKDLLENKLEKLDKLDIFKCKDIKAMAQADNSLFLDKEFFENKIRPCRDELTQIYIDSYYSIPFQVIWPDSQISIEQMLSGMVKKGNFSKGAATAMLDTLVTIGLVFGHGRSLAPHVYYNWLKLSQFYRFTRRTIYNSFRNS